MASRGLYPSLPAPGWPSPPPAQGLYDPAREHDACGVGFVADLKGRPSHAIVQYGLRILENLTHRGAVGADPKAGDGAGMLVQIPHEFLKEVCAPLGIKLPEPGHYGVGHMFMPRNRAQRIYCEQVVARVRRRNLAISTGILLLLGASAAMIVLSSQRARRLAEQQVEFVAGVSHELRTPVAVVCSAGENLADGLVRDEARLPLDVRRPLYERMHPGASTDYPWLSERPAPRR